jgi:hypothetical protein
MDRTVTTKTTTTEQVVFEEEEILAILKEQMIAKYPQMVDAEGNFMTKPVRAGFGNMTRDARYVVFNLLTNSQTTN